jgi:hypothetical protein
VSKFVSPLSSLQNAYCECVVYWKVLHRATVIHTMQICFCIACVGDSVTKLRPAHPRFSCPWSERYGPLSHGVIAG